MTVMTSAAGQISLVAALLPDADRDRIDLMVRALEREAAGTRLPAPSEAERTVWGDATCDLLTARISDPTRRDIAVNRSRALAGRPLSGPDFHLVGNLISRVDQQHLVATTPGLTRLANPGAQAHLYDLGEDGRPTSVWYATYGSNMRRERMAVYIHGGSISTNPAVFAGTRDQTPIRASIPISLPGTVHFAGHSRLWGGAMAFLDTAAPGRSLGRAHLMTTTQFDDVVFQESNGAVVPDGTPVDLSTTLRAGRKVGLGRYSTLVHVGDYQGVPVVTFTAPFSTSHALSADLLVTADGHVAPAATRNPAAWTVQTETRLREEAAATAEGRPQIPTPEDWPVFTAPPSTTYRAMIAAGLVEAHALSEAQVDAYFAGATGHASHRHAPRLALLSELDVADLEVAVA